MRREVDLQETAEQLTQAIKIKICKNN